MDVSILVVLGLKVDQFFPFDCRKLCSCVDW